MMEEHHAEHEHSHDHPKRQTAWAWKGWDSRCAIKEKVFRTNNLGENAFITVQRGNIPIIITCPHDGVGVIPHVSRRKEGVSVRDTKASLVADELRCCIEELLNPHRFKSEKRTDGTFEAKDLRKQLVTILRKRYDTESRGVNNAEAVLSDMKQEGRIEEGEEEVLLHILQSVEEMNNRDIYLRPYLVVANFSRKYCDLNRPPAKAFEDGAVAPYHVVYHEIIRRYILEVNELMEGTDFPPILLDLHGQGAEADTIFRGTCRGKTVQRLLTKHGEDAVIGPHSILGFLEAKYQYKVFPPYAPSSLMQEDKRFRGGYTVRHHGSSNSGDGHIDAIQLELGKHLRCLEDQRNVFATRLAEATLLFLSHFNVPTNTNTNNAS